MAVVVRASPRKLSRRVRSDAHRAKRLTVYTGARIVAEEPLGASDEDIHVSTSFRDRRRHEPPISVRWELIVRKIGPRKANSSGQEYSIAHA